MSTQVTKKKKLTLASKALSPYKIKKIIEILDKSFPGAHCELFHKSPFQLLVSVVLSAQTTDKMVNRVMKPIYEEGFDPQIVLSWGEEKFLSKIRSIGLAPTKSKNIIKLTEKIIKDHASQVPKTRKELEALAGVGRKTASVILGEIYKEPTLAVDTHVFRVTKRLGFHNESQAEKAEKKLLQLIPKKYLPKAHHLFIFEGRYVCLARKPKCEICALKTLCPSKDNF